MKKKYISLFEEFLMETNHLNTVLDKIADHGIESLTPIEKEYLNSFKMGKEKDWEQKFDQQEKEMKQEPKEKERDITIATAPPEEVVYTVLANFWNEIDDVDYSRDEKREMKEDFLNKFDHPANVLAISWEELPDNVKEDFKYYIQHPPQ